MANWIADFYEASTNPATLTTGYSERPLRLWAADFSYFGITTTNNTSIKNFIIHFNGNSDMAFVTYNTASSFIVLPVGISTFTSSLLGNDIQVLWKTETENNSSYFDVEGSKDGIHFNALGKLDAAGNIAATQFYSFKDYNAEGGVHYYRLKQYDWDGNYTYSKIIRQVTSVVKRQLNVYPNPAVKNITVNHAGAVTGDVLNLYSSLVQWLWTKNFTSGDTKTTLSIASFPKGDYIFQLSSAQKEISSARFLIK